MRIVDKEEQCYEKWISAMMLAKVLEVRVPWLSCVGENQSNVREVMTGTQHRERAAAATHGTPNCSARCRSLLCVGSAAQLHFLLVPCAGNAQACVSTAPALSGSKTKCKNADPNVLQRDDSTVSYTYSESQL